MIGCLDVWEAESQSSLSRSCIHPFILPSSSPIARLLALQAKVDEHSQAIACLKTLWSFVATGIALVVTALKDWLFGQK